MIPTCVQLDAMKHTSSESYTSLLTMSYIEQGNSISSYCEEHCLTAEECVQLMRDAVFHETKLTVSAGIAPNKVSKYAANISFEHFNNLTCSDARKGTFPVLLALLSKSLIYSRYAPIRFVLPICNFDRQFYKSRDRTNQMVNFSLLLIQRSSRRSCMISPFAKYPELVV